MVKAPEKHWNDAGKLTSGGCRPGLQALSISKSEAVYAGAAACLVLARIWWLRLLT